ncbi:glycosyltransferase family 2 protein [Flavimaricola marinus]|uniref:Putative glycosyl transferase n=1 Tax=Flavimaricola marinus TaxID=1819565 RepID=A0A238LK39_9RHOB|nr:glycosyltransferase [Flavimaricola marinus]SMY09240.1 putative glycosyl transferase [Flavimaricola marinus]
MTGVARRLLRAVRRRLSRSRYAIDAARRAPPPAALRPALVIPVHNDADGLARLLAQARAMNCFAQIVVVDDGSTPPVTLPEGPGMILLRHDHAKGGGVARNLGLTAVTEPHVLFFDADDLLTDELPRLLTALGGAGDFDFCQFKYADSRVQAEALRGHPDWDEVFWERAGLSVGHLRDAPPQVWPVLAQTANYPWNKVYRTGFLRDHDIGCAATQVHQDIPLHWLGYLAADRILTSDRICAWHHVNAAGGRLTNRSGPERLEVFDALAPVMVAADAADPDWQCALSTFVLGLIDWGEGQIAPELRSELRHREAAFLSATVAPWLPAIEGADAGLAQRIRTRMEPST